MSVRKDECDGFEVLREVSHRSTSSAGGRRTNTTRGGVARVGGETRNLGQFGNEAMWLARYLRYYVAGQVPEAL